MKAFVYKKYGPPDVLQLKDIEKPAPKDNEVLVKVHAASVNAADWHLLTADIFAVRLMMGLTRPKRSVLGADVAGVVEAVGKNVTQFKPGDAVFGCIFMHGSGSFAEYAVCIEDSLVPKPGILSFEEAAAVPLASITALQAMQKAGTSLQGKEVLIQGAGGGVGTFALQLAKYFGAIVTAVCGPGNVEQSRSLGADHVVDYTKENAFTGGKRFDAILGINGFQPSSVYKRALKENGVYIMVGGNPRQIFQGVLMGPLLALGSRKKFLALSAKANKRDLDFIKERIVEGRIKPVIDKRFSFEKTADAMRYLGQGHAHGKIVVVMV
ncbi:MAG TPA: NAD(P)-dependent alcohol dehydrogenase [Chitinivibrionales bacterium]|nr:NAD(P)-dependent alcohol dehydrogenase [Chitinivibrionales bacterium]